MKVTLMLLGAVGVLLFAGGFPPVGAPGVYHGGAMLLAGAAAGLLCFWGAWRLAAGQRVRLVAGLVCLFLAGAGVVGLWRFGGEAWRLAGMGGAMWFGAVGLGCMALIGLFFGAIFGFLARRIMTGALWLAALHVCVGVALVGAWVDLLGSESAVVKLEPGGAAAKASEREVAGDGARVTLRVEDFQVERYEGAESYSLLRHEGGRWLPVGTPERRGDVVTLGGESWPVSSLRRVAQMPQPFLLLPGEPPRLLVQHEAPVKDYRARCRWVIHRAGEADEERVESLRVNEPVACAGRLFYLMSYRPLGHGGVEVELLVRRAPGRFLMLLGLVGAVLCTACWSLGRREPQGRSEP